MDALIYTLHHTRRHTSLTHCTIILSAFSIPCLLVHRINSKPTSTNFRQFSLSFISRNLSYKQNMYSFLCIGVPSRSYASTQHHVLPTSQEFPIPLRLPTSILCHTTSHLQYQFYSPVFCSLIHKYQQHALFVILRPRSPHLLSAYMYSGQRQN